jgi:hypothetical protein
MRRLFLVGDPALGQLELVTGPQNLQVTFYTSEISK